MLVVKRDGSRESVKFDKISNRIESLCGGLNRNYVDPIILSKKVIDGLYDGVTTEELDDLAAETAATMVMTHPDYGTLATRLVVSKLHKRTSGSFSNTMKRLYQNIDVKTNSSASLISSKAWKVIHQNASILDAAINHERDFDYDYFGYKTLERSYLMRINGQIVERPQHMLMRVAVGIHFEDINSVLQTYKLLSEKWFTHATPTLFNAATPKPQMSSCFLLTMKEDSIAGIYDTLKQCAEISQSAGGIGLAIHQVRAKGSYIKGTGGTSNGIIPMLRTFDMTARYVDQGGGKRKGSFAIYLEPWHADIFEFLDLKKNSGKEELRARDLFYGLWIPDLFMKRAEENEKWSLFCPNECPGLSELYGADFEKLYLKYESEGKFKRQVNARELWDEILVSQIETGTPYMLYKDAANTKSNQKNLGTIKSSNLCTEIMEYTAPDEVAVCNLASIALPKFVTNDGVFDHKKLYEITKVITRNLNKVIDENYYPVPEARNSNLRHRPIGLGVQGLADVFVLLRMPFSSEQAKRLNEDIFETIYYAALEASMELASRDGYYETFKGSPASEGILQFDMWNVVPKSGRWNWSELKEKIKENGLRNSLLVAPMPTASTSQILGNNECFEPYTSNLYTRRTLAGDFIMVNRKLIEDLVQLGLWNETMKQKIIANDGSIQSIIEIPSQIRELYKTVWEISQKVIIDMAADRGAYICQSQSMNLFLSQPTIGSLTSMHFHAWKKGLKTGMYYLRTNAAAQAIKFTLDKTLLKNEDNLNKVPEAVPISLQHAGPYSNSDAIACAIDNPDSCEVCGS